jgi:hypothetical protein
MYFVCANDVRCMDRFGRSSKEVGRVEKPELLGRSQRSSNCEKVPACSHSSVVRVNLASLEFTQLRAFLLAKPSSHRIGLAYTGGIVAAAARIHRWWQSYRKTYGHNWHLISNIASLLGLRQASSREMRYQKYI